MSVRQENLFHQKNQSEISPEVSSIFKYYNVQNEVNFVSKQLEKGVNSTSIQRYLDNSVHRFLGEFVGKILVDKIDYQLRNGKIMFEGVADPVGDIYDKRGKLNGKGSREQAEATGFRKIEKQFANNDANMAFWISPPSVGVEGFGDYGFLFVFIKDTKNHIDEYILRYQGENKQLEKSLQKYNELISLYPAIKLDEKVVASYGINGFLEDPLFAQTQDPERFLGEIGYKDLLAYRKFHQKLDQEILFRNWLDEYINIIFCTLQENNFLLKKDLIDQAERSLAGIYNLAQDIRDDRFITQIKKNTRYPDYSEMQLAMIMRQSYVQKEAVVVGGGSCPADTKKTRSPLQNSWEDILENKGVLSFNSASELTSESSNRYDDYKCPGCGKEIKGEIKGSSPETWTPECSCGYKFHCGKKDNQAVVN